MGNIRPDPALGADTDMASLLVSNSGVGVQTVEAEGADDCSDDRNVVHCGGLPKSMGLRTSNSNRRGQPSSVWRRRVSRRAKRFPQSSHLKLRAFRWTYRWLILDCVEESRERGKALTLS